MTSFIWTPGLQKCGTCYLFYKVLNHKALPDREQYDIMHSSSCPTALAKRSLKAWKKADLLWNFELDSHLFNNIFKRKYTQKPHCIFLIRDLSEQFEAWHWNCTQKHRNEPAGSPHTYVDLTREQLYRRDIAKYRQLPQKINALRQRCHTAGHMFHLITFEELCNTHPVELLNSRDIPFDADIDWQPHTSSRKPVKRYAELDNIYREIVR